LSAVSAASNDTRRKLWAVKWQTTNVSMTSALASRSRPRQPRKPKLRKAKVRKFQFMLTLSGPANRRIANDRVAGQKIPAGRV
jgi:hypothetical protein